MQSTAWNVVIHVTGQVGQNWNRIGVAKVRTQVVLLGPRPGRFAAPNVPCVYSPMFGELGRRHGVLCRIPIDFGRRG